MVRPRVQWRLPRLRACGSDPLACAILTGWHNAGMTVDSSHPKHDIHKLLYFICSRPRTAIVRSAILCIAVGLLAVLIHSSTLGFFVPAMANTFVSGFLAAAGAIMVVVIIAMGKRIHGSPFQLTPGLCNGGVAELHFPLTYWHRLQSQKISNEMAETLHHLHPRGISKVQLCSVLVGKDDFRKKVIAKLNADFRRKNLSWMAVDAGTKKSFFYDAVYWATFVAIPILLKAFGIKHRESVEMKRFRRRSDWRMTWGKIFIKIS